MMLFRTAMLVLFLCTALIVSVPMGTSAQDGNVMMIESKMSFTVLDTMEGDGKVQLTFEGDPAVKLRQSIFGVKEDYTNFDTNNNQYLEVSEARAFLVAFTDALAGRQHWGMTINSPTDFENMTDYELRHATSGIVDTGYLSTDVMSISIRFDCIGESVTKLMRPSEVPLETFAGALNTVTGFTFDGTLIVKDRVMMFGMSSFTSPDLVAGKISELRTPIGTIIWYTFEGEVLPGESAIQETMTYEPFSIYENSQISFIVLLFGCILILRISAKRFNKYLMQHPKRFRGSAKQLPIVRWFTWALVGILSLFYVLPFMFSFASGSTMIYGSYLYFLVPGFIFASYVFSKTLYDRASSQIPDDLVIPVKQAVVKQDDDSYTLRCQMCMRPIDAEKELYECICGHQMHMDCAEKAQACPQCGEVLFPEHTRSIQCKACDETFLSTGEEDPYTLQCTRCGAFQEEVKGGRSYIIVDIDSRRGYNMIRAMGLSGRPALIMTNEFPGKVREQFDLGDDFDVKCMCDSTTDIDSVNIHDLDGDAMETVSTFLMTTKRSGLLIEGLEAILSENGFEATLAFVKRVNDLSAIHGASVIVPVNKERIPEDEYKIISDEFDEVHDYL
ncbi:MAG: DUF835 domain-containing protein [Methanomassiliicoccus sp.]|nr:MAG: DUF835 domain-containing protein [Methanomassiliicoccus sp.]